MEKWIQKISHILSFIFVFFLSAAFYFSFKGFTYIDGNVVLAKPVAEAAEHHGIATVLPSNLMINASDKYAVGSLYAPLTMYEYSSLGCPHCADFHLDVMPKLEEEYVSRGLLRVVFVHFPLDKKSMKAAMISRCLTYENYHNFIRTLFDRQRFWFLDRSDDQLFRFAAENGLSYDETQACTSDDRVAQEIISDRQDGVTRLHIQGTPAFLFSGSDGNEIIYGVPNYEKLREYINNRLGLRH